MKTEKMPCGETVVIETKCAHIFICAVCQNSIEKLASKPLTDFDLMPFGPYQGKSMKEIPASYFHFLWTKSNLRDSQSSVAEYIRRNLETLKLKFQDQTWEPLPKRFYEQKRT